MFLVREGLPFAAYAALARRLPPGRRALVICVALAPVALTLGAGVVDAVHVARPALAFVYLTFAGALVHGMAEWYRRGYVPRVALFLVCALLFVAAPAVLERSVAAHLIGWEMMFAAYSYCVDTARQKQSPRLGDCLFFLLVNPTLVYRERGQQLPVLGSCAPGLSRIGVGLACVGIHHALFAAFATHAIFAPVALTAIDGLSSYGRFAIHHFAFFFSSYVVNSGRASLEIGLMRLVGWEVPERYHWPLLATGPADFWRRWNIYLGLWARIYLFSPSALWLGRRLRLLSRRLRRVGVALAVLFAFAAIGAAHDYSLVFQNRFVWPAPATIFFLLNGFLLLASLAGGGLADRISKRSRARTFVSWVLALHLILFMAAIGLPALSGEGLPTWLPGL